MSAATGSERLESRPTFSELFTPKLVTVLREGYGLKQLHADAIAGLTVAIVALPLSMAIAIASRRIAGSRPLHRDRRRLPRFGSRRQPLPDRRTGGRLHRAGGVHRSAPRRRRADPRHDDVGRLSAGDRLSQARHLHQIHPLSRDGRLYGGHRGHHLRQPAQRALRPVARRQGAGRADPEAQGARRRLGNVQPVGDRGRPPDRRDHCRR